MKLGVKFTLTTTILIVILGAVLEIISLFIFTRAMHTLNKKLFVQKIDQLLIIAYEQDELFFEGIYKDDGVAKFRVIDKLRIEYRNEKDNITFPFIVDNTGKIILHPIYEKGYQYFDKGIMQQISKDKTGEFEYNHNSLKKWYVFSEYEPWNWFFCMTTTIHKKNEPIINFIVVTLIIAAVVVLLSIFIVLFTAQIHINPLNKVVERLNKISRGEADFSQKLDVSPHASDEISMLYQAFNKMSQDLSNVTVSKNYFDKIISNMTDMLIVLSPDGKITTDNKAISYQLGYFEGELIGKGISLLFPEEEVLLKGTQLDKLIKEGQLINYEAHLLAKSGKKIPVLLSGAVMKDDNGQITNIVCIAKDITERKQAEVKLRQREKQLEKQNEIWKELTKHEVIFKESLDVALREITEASSMGIGIDRVSVWLFDPQRTKIVCLDLYVHSKSQHSKGAELSVSSFPSYFNALETKHTIVADDANNDPCTKEFSEPYLKVMGITSMLDMPIRIGGKIEGVLCLEHVGPMRSWSIEEQNFAASLADFVSLILEAFERKRAEQEAKETADRFSAVIDSVGDGITFSDDQGLYFVYNIRMQEITGYSFEEANRFGNFNYLYPDVLERQKAIDNLTRVLKEGFCEEFETTIQAKDGSKKILLISTRRIKYQNSVMFLSVYRDITERQKAEIQIKEGNKKLKVNEIALRNILYDLSKSHKELLATQSQLVQSEKLASLGQLSAGIAHEINNPLGFITNNIVILEEYIESYLQILRAMEGLKKTIEDKDLDKAGKKVQEINALEEKLNLDFITGDIENLIRQSKSGAERIKKIVQDLRTFARKDEGQMELNNVEEILDGVINIVWNEIKYTAELKKEYGGVPLVKCNAQKLGQVFINLLVNAAQSIKEKGEITVKTYSDEKHVCIEISDTGCGIPKENISKIFDPFFTTKEVGKGTGLGLSIGYDIIKQHKGKMDVLSEINKGTKFTVKLPV
ncbi:MAG TPA: hypothetical protein DDX37_09165 [Candidatus Omnitrophica bacterium]|nr:hypothetical protein [Candidatus Omnitrophota bacterium]